MIHKLLRLLFIAGTLALVVSVFMERKAFKSMLPKEYDILERFNDVRLSNEKTPAPFTAPEVIEPKVEVEQVESVDSIKIDTIK